VNVLLVSQCNMRALVETRRILDQFAERKGERTWQTAITQEGLITLRKMLRKTARRNTAVACHWIKAANRTELLWIVGNAQRFNEQGSVPTNTTQRDILRTERETYWHTLEDVALLAGIAGLFHDFGKANKYFQDKIKPSGRSKLKDPFRHEWVSLRIFQAFVGKQSDREWLEKLERIKQSDEPELLAALSMDGLMDRPGNPFATLKPPVARAVGWLIVAHHRLPKWLGKREEGGAPRLDQIDQWLEGFKFGPDWNSPGALEPGWKPEEKKKVWTFPHGTPFRSETWRRKAHSLAVRALKRPNLDGTNQDLMSDTFTLHMARMVLMLADHHYSSQEATPAWQDAKYGAFANTDRNTGALKQKLDEHVVGVGHNAVLVARGLSVLRQTLPAITRHKGFKQRCVDERFRWQNKAYELACGIRMRAAEHGFFGVNMASTGCGKTFANGRIMYGLANEKLGCRFSVALGLRTLTLQTGSALRERLRLEDDDLAVLIGSQAVRELHEARYEAAYSGGSESAEELLAEQQYVSYEGALDDSRVGKWLQKTPKLHQLVSSPILVSTIDHLIPATEGERGGKQIAPMLRLFTSDLVLDEPDDFDLNDLPALTRLVNWAGVLGSRVLVSSATLPPALIRALFAAYAAGRRVFQQAYGEPNRALSVCCAWFDENGVAQSNHADEDGFAIAHHNFVKTRVARLRKAEPVRRAELLAVHAEEAKPEAAIMAIAQVVYDAIHKLHREHAQIHPDTNRKVSIGLVRMANIKPMVAVARQLLLMSPPADQRTHYCVYHSQHPLAVRSAMEERLDAALTRHDPQAIWQPDGVIGVAMGRHSEKHHIFVVLATSVAEVGRDHDYDWAIAEPSSMRSLIQLAGRIQRHRNQVPATPNLLILSRNYRSLIGRPIAFEKPGFESQKFSLRSHDLHDLLEPDQWRIISSVPRIVERSHLDIHGNLADLEHAHLAARLFGSEQAAVKSYAALWWEHQAHWNAELQNRSRFRQSEPTGEYVLYLEEEGEKPQFNAVDDRGELKPCDLKFERVEIALAPRVTLWGENDIGLILENLAESMEMDLVQASRKFGVISLPERVRWKYHEALGVYDTLD
jgi:CRISPR-associated endonuclease/helicase Cas3